jgi:hypothetical protein
MNFHKINKQLDLEIFVISTTFPLEFLKYFNIPFLKLIYAESDKNIVYFCSLSLHPRTLLSYTIRYPLVPALGFMSLNSSKLEYNVCDGKVLVCNEGVQ